MTPVAHVPVWRGIIDRLGVRFAFFLTAALLPLGILIFLQTADLQRQAQIRSEAALMGATLQAAAPELQTLRVAEGLALALSKAVLPYVNDTAACSRVMAGVQEVEPIYSLIAYTPLSGLMTCASGGQTFDFSNNPLFQDFVRNPRPRFIVNKHGPVSGTSVLGILQPVRDDGGKLIGMVSLSVPHTALKDRENLAGLPPAMIEGRQPIALITFDETGEILTSTVGLEDAPNRIPRDRTLHSLVVNTPESFSGPSVAGSQQSFSVVPLAEGHLFVLGTWPVESTVSVFGLQVPPFLFPALMWLASLVVAMLAAERLVTRHIRVLGRSVLSFARGNRSMPELDLGSGPVEIREVGDAFLKMADSVMHDEAELENTVHQKEVLLREVHHRVKNNLQLIASIMSLQIRQSKSPEAKELMKGLQDRVMSLATIHRELYQTSGVTDVRADELLRDIVRQIANMATGPGRTFHIETSFDDLRLTPDQAVPMALLLTEAMTNALKYAGHTTGDLPQLSVSLHRLGATNAVLEVANTLGGPLPPGMVSPIESTGLGGQLLVAFAQQLGGTIETKAEDGMFRLRTSFPVRSLAEAEARNMAQAAAEP